MKTAIAIAAVFAMLATGWAVIQWGRAAAPIVADVHAVRDVTTGGAAATVAAANLTRARVNSEMHLVTQFGAAFYAYLFGQQASAKHPEVKGLLPAATAAVLQLQTAVQHTDESLNGKLGVLPTASAALREFAPTLKSFAELAGAARKTITDVDSLLTDPDFRAGYKAGIAALKSLGNASGNVDKATATFAGILEDVRHPEKPSTFVRGLGFMFALIRSLGPTAAALLK